MHAFSTLRFLPLWLFANHLKCDWYRNPSVPEHSDQVPVDKNSPSEYQFGAVALSNSDIWAEGWGTTLSATAATRRCSPKNYRVMLTHIGPH